VRPKAPVIQITPCESLGSLAVHGYGCISHIPTSLLLAKVGCSERAKEVVKAVAHLEWGEVLQHDSTVALVKAAGLNLPFLDNINRKS